MSLTGGREGRAGGGGGMGGLVLDGFGGRCGGRRGEGAGWGWEGIANAGGGMREGEGSEELSSDSVTWHGR